MDSKSLFLAFGAGLATFLLVGGAVTALFEQWVEFSLFIGIPVGLLAAIVVAGGVGAGLTADAPATRRRIARLVSGFSLGFLGALAVLFLVWDGGVTASLGVAIVVGLAGSILFDWMKPLEPADQGLAPTE
jgi:hypothetical protein